MKIDETNQLRQSRLTALINWRVMIDAFRNYIPGFWLCFLLDLVFTDPLSRLPLPSPPAEVGGNAGAGCSGGWSSWCWWWWDPPTPPTPPPPPPTSIGQLEGPPAPPSQSTPSLSSLEVTFWMDWTNILSLTWKGNQELVNNPWICSIQCCVM